MPRPAPTIIPCDIDPKHGPAVMITVGGPELTAEQEAELDKTAQPYINDPTNQAGLFALASMMESLIQRRHFCAVCAVDRLKNPPKGESGGIHPAPGFEKEFSEIFQQAFGTIELAPPPRRKRRKR